MNICPMGGELCIWTNGRTDGQMWRS